MFQTISFGALRRARRFALILTLMTCLGLAQARADAPDPDALCERAAIHAARQTGVPLEVLRAVALTETGRKRNGRVSSWPWAVNAAGTGIWFDTREAAAEFVGGKIRSGLRNIDLGCFQVNYRWHGQEFRSFEAMMDPQTNALYAARFLTELYQEFGSWRDAVGAYHSRSRERARVYLARFDRILRRVNDEAAVGQADAGIIARTGSPPAPPRDRNLPSGAGSLSAGSLVSFPGGAAGRLISLSPRPTLNGLP